MSFPQDIIKQAWARSGGYCECERIVHEHKDRCNRVLLISCRGDKDSLYGWEAHSTSGRYLNSISDCEILCWDCHAKTFW